MKQWPNHAPDCGKNCMATFRKWCTVWPICTSSRRRFSSRTWTRSTSPLLRISPKTARYDPNLGQFHRAKPHSSTIGNLIGGALMVRLMYGSIYLRPSWSGKGALGGIPLTGQKEE